MPLSNEHRLIRTGLDAGSCKIMASRVPISCSMTVDGKPSALAGLCEAILRKLERSGFSKEDIFAVHLALGEAFINAVKHGNKMDLSKKVTVDYSVDLDKVEICMTDQGEGFDPKAVPDPRVGQNLYKPEGRGLLLISSYMDVVKFSERGNRVYMVRYKEKPQMRRNQRQTQD